MGQIITFASGKGGVGKTVVTAALGAAVAASGKKVLLLDGDMGLRDLDLVLGLEGRVLFDVFDVATGRCFEEDAILEVRPGLDFLPASQRYRWEEVPGDALLTVLEDVREDYDYMFIDSPAGIGKGLFYTLRMADRIILVAEPTWVSLRDTDRVMAYLHEERLFDYGLIFNNFHAAHVGGYLNFDEMYDRLQPERLVGVLPFAQEVVDRSQAGEMANIEHLGVFTAPLQQTAECLVDEYELPPETWREFLEKIYPYELRKKPTQLERRRAGAAAWRRRGRW